MQQRWPGRVADETNGTVWNMGRLTGRPGAGQPDLDRRDGADEVIVHGGRAPSAPDIRHQAQGLDVDALAAAVEIEEPAAGRCRPADRRRCAGEVAMRPFRDTLKRPLLAQSGRK